MYCPSCGNEITVELKYCNRCGANLSLPTPVAPGPIVAPVKLTAPTLVLGLTITISLGIIISGAAELARVGLHPAAIAWIVLFSTACLFGFTSLLIRFWSKLLMLQRESPQPQQLIRPANQQPQQQLPPRLEPVPSVTEHTTRTFSPTYKEPNR